MIIGKAKGRLVAPKSPGRQTMKVRRSVAAIAVLAAGGALAVTMQVRAGGEKIAFPEGFEKGTLYSVLDRFDNKQYRELYASPGVVEAVRKGQGVPGGAVLTLVQYKAKVDEKGVPVKDAKGRFIKGDLVAYTVMEKRKGWGAEYADDIRNGEWEYQAFTPDKKVNDKANLKACFQCHKPHEKQDFVISLARLDGTFPDAPVAKKTGPGIVSIGEFLFGPEKIEVQRGQTIAWTNTDDSPHQVTVQGQTTLRTPVILKGQSTALTFNNIGSYDYICGLHTGMKGKIEVK
jgi:plastocyanin